MSGFKKACKERGISENTLAAIFLTIAHKKGEVNKDFQFINATENINFGNKPLIALSPTKFLLCDTSWCCPGFYKTLETLSEATSDHAPNKIGFGLEILIFDAFHKKGITFSGGNFLDINNQKAECDMLVETADKIIIIEIKKK